LLKFDKQQFRQNLVYVFSVVADRNDPPPPPMPPIPEELKKKKNN
jgi:hypothetical protein